MRRMLDPKEAGGSTAKLYKHTISAFSSTYGSIQMTLYNYSDVAIDSAKKIATAIKSGGKVVATGYLKNNDTVYNVYSVIYLPADNAAFVNGYRIDTTSGNVKTSSMALDYHFSFEDSVSAVS